MKYPSRLKMVKSVLYFLLSEEGRPLTKDLLINGFNGFRFMDLSELKEIYNAFIDNSGNEEMGMLWDSINFEDDDKEDIKGIMCPVSK